MTIPGFECPSGAGGTHNKFQKYMAAMGYAISNQICDVPQAQSRPLSVSIGDILDGSSNTVLMAEKVLMDAPFLAVGSIWGTNKTCGNRLTIVSAHAEMNTPFDGSHDAATNCYIENTVSNATRAAVASPHEGGAHFLMADGSVRFISENVDSNPALGNQTGNFLYQNLFQIRDGNTIGEF